MPNPKKLVTFNIYPKSIDKSSDVACTTCNTRSISGDPVPSFLSYLCTSNTNETITFENFLKSALYYSENIKPEDTSPKALYKLFVMLMLLFRKTNTGTISRSKVLNFDWEFHNFYVKNYNILQLGLPPYSPNGSRSLCSGCPGCPSDDSQSGCSCDCAWGVCAGQCVADTCNPSMPWGCS